MASLNINMKPTDVIILVRHLTGAELFNLCMGKIELCSKKQLDSCIHKLYMCDIDPLLILLFHGPNIVLLLASSFIDLQSSTMMCLHTFS